MQGKLPSEIKVSLRTKDPHEAQRLFAEENLRFERKVALARGDFRVSCKTARALAGRSI